VLSTPKKKHTKAKFSSRNKDTIFGRGIREVKKKEEGQTHLNLPSSLSPLEKGGVRKQCG